MASTPHLDPPATLRPGRIAIRQDSPAIVPGSQRTRPLWFDGRFLAARDLERDQHDFLRRQGDLGRAAGFGVVHGLMVQRVASPGQPPDAESIAIGSGHGITPGGDLVTIAKDLTVRLSDLAEEQSLDVQFGMSRIPAPLARARTGLYVIALRPVQFTANPIASYPASVQGQPAHDGDVVEATVVSLVPYPLPASNVAAGTRNAAAAWQIFVAGNPGQLSTSLLPLAMVSVERGAIEWLDPYLVRRESGPEFGGLRFGLTHQAAQQAFLLQYDAQLRQVVESLARQNRPARFGATDHFQALPPVGRFPLASINTDAFTQLFFPPQADVRLSLVPDDELPALIDDSMSLSPIDLTLPASAYADLAIFALVPLSRQRLAAFAPMLPQVALTSALPQVPSLRMPADLLRLLPRGGASRTTRTADSRAWRAAVGAQVYGYYVRRRSLPLFVDHAAATTTTLSVLPIAGSHGWTLTAAVSPSTATGTVTFMDGSTSLGTVDLAAGTATLIVPSPAAGMHPLTAVYNGNSNLAGSTSATVNQNV